MSRLRFRPEVAEDVRAARSWYAERSDTLPGELVEELERQLCRIEESPMQFPVVHRDIRRALVRRFPYAIFFRVEQNEVVVFAVMHQAMDPRSWKKRA